jgi:hypothetical protein
VAGVIGSGMLLAVNGCSGTPGGHGRDIGRLELSQLRDLDLFVPKPVPRSPDQRSPCPVPARSGRSHPLESVTVRGDRHSVGHSPRRARRHVAQAPCGATTPLRDAGR